MDDDPKSADARVAKLAEADDRLVLLNTWRRRTHRDVVMTRLETDPRRVRVREVTATGEVLAERFLAPGDNPIDVALIVTGLNTTTVGQPRRRALRHSRRPG